MFLPEGKIPKHVFKYDFLLCIMTCNFKPFKVMLKEKFKMREFFFFLSKKETSSFPDIFHKPLELFGLSQMWKVTGAIWEKLVVTVERSIYQQFRQPERLRLLNRNCVARSDQALASIGKAAWSRKTLDSQDYGSRASRVEWLQTVDTVSLISLESRSSRSVFEDFSSFWGLKGTIRAGIDVTFIVCHWLVDSWSS